MWKRQVSTPMSTPTPTPTVARALQATPVTAVAEDSTTRTIARPSLTSSSSSTCSTRDLLDQDVDPRQLLDKRNPFYNFTQFNGLCFYVENSWDKDDWQRYVDKIQRHGGRIAREPGEDHVTHIVLLHLRAPTKNKQIIELDAIPAPYDSKVWPAKRLVRTFGTIVQGRSTRSGTKVVVVKQWLDASILANGALPAAKYEVVGRYRPNDSCWMPAPTPSTSEGSLRSPPSFSDSPASLDRSLGLDRVEPSLLLSPGDSTRRVSFGTTTVPRVSHIYAAPGHKIQDDQLAGPSLNSLRVEDGGPSGFSIPTPPLSATHPEPSKQAGTSVLPMVPEGHSGPPQGYYGDHPAERTSERASPHVQPGLPVKSALQPCDIIDLTAYSDSSDQEDANDSDDSDLDELDSDDCDPDIKTELVRRARAWSASLREQNQPPTGIWGTEEGLRRYPTTPEGATVDLPDLHVPDPDLPSPSTRETRQNPHRHCPT